MIKMLYTSRQPRVTITPLPDGKRDVTVLTNEQEVPIEPGNPMETPVETPVEPPAETPTGEPAIEPTAEEPSTESPAETSPVDQTENPTTEELPTEPPEKTLPERPVMYQYDGNQFRTVYEISEEDVLADMDKYLNYSSDDEPTLEQLQHDHALIDSFTLELMEGGLL